MQPELIALLVVRLFGVVYVCFANRTVVLPNGQPNKRCTFRAVPTCLVSCAVFHQWVVNVSCPLPLKYFSVRMLRYYTRLFICPTRILFCADSLLFLRCFYCVCVPCYWKPAWRIFVVSERS